MTDPIADMLTRIRNAQSINHAEVLVPYSKVKFELGSILQKEGFVKNVEVIGKAPQKNIKIDLKYKNSQSVIKFIKRVSKPGKRVYRSKDDLPWVMQNTGIAIISTSQGLVTNKEARKKGIGGEVVCEIW